MNKKSSLLLLSFFLPGWIACQQNKTNLSEFSATSTVQTGKPATVMLTAYSTTLLANGKDQTQLRLAVTDSLNRQILTATDTLKIYVTGEGQVTTLDGAPLPVARDTADRLYAICPLQHGVAYLLFTSGITPGQVKVEASSGTLWPGAHEIHTLPKDFELQEPRDDQLPITTKHIDRMIGADISFLPQLEANGRIFTEKQDTLDAIQLLKQHGFNTIRLRLFVEPENEKGYAPDKGYCGLTYTLAMARRIKNAGLQCLLDFHYSDYWADPQQQFKPKRWADLDFTTLLDSVKVYTTNVLQTLQAQGTPPDMVQIGNEINHGLLWPEGHISHPDQLAALLKAGVDGVKAADPDMPVMMHIALGGQHDEAVFWLNNMIARGVVFDIIGLSYYPRWHGTLDDLKYNLMDLCSRFHKPVNVVEYSNFNQEVHEIVFSLPGDMGKGACIWEPLNERSGLFDHQGQATSIFAVYDTLAANYLPVDMTK